MVKSSFSHLCSAMTRDLGLETALQPVTVVGKGGLASRFPVTEFAAASLATAGCALRALLSRPEASLDVDQRLASYWFSASHFPVNRAPTSLWDEFAGDYPTRDGWIRLHTNAPHHRRAMESVLGVSKDKTALAQRAIAWGKTELETAIVAAGGCAAEMLTRDEWLRHPHGKTVAAEPLFWQQHHAEAPRPGKNAQGSTSDPPKGESSSRPCSPTPMCWCMATGRMLWKPWALMPKPDSCSLPGLVDVSLNAWGWHGPWRNRRGFDSLVQMSSGIAEAGMRWKNTGRPHPLPVQALDHATGYLIAAAVLKGLQVRHEQRQGYSARLSLARCAEVLMSHRADEQPEPAALGRHDFQPMMEWSAFGLGNRLTFPLRLAGTPVIWGTPPAALGSAKAAWG